MKETISDAGSSWICLLAYFVPAVLEVLIFSNCKDQLEHLLISAKAVLNVSIDNLFHLHSLEEILIDFVNCPFFHAKSIFDELADEFFAVNKIDLLPYVNFDIDKCEEYARRVNPKIRCLRVSATKGDGMDKWMKWLETELTLATL